MFNFIELGLKDGAIFKSQRIGLIYPLLFKVPVLFLDFYTSTDPTVLSILGKVDQDAFLRLGTSPTA